MGDRKRVSFIVEVDLDPTGGYFGDGSSAQTAIQGILDQRINHYNPTVKLRGRRSAVEEPELTPVQEVAADIELVEWFKRQYEAGLIRIADLPLPDSVKQELNAKYGKTADCSYSELGGCGGPVEKNMDWHITAAYLCMNHKANAQAILEAAREKLNKPELPHSRACGPFNHEHGPQCHENCPTCGTNPNPITYPKNPQNLKRPISYERPFDA